ncbi:MAG TPA: hypothetical protein VMG10_20195 [Gemmataceae bacterium]|nr:hypothetical protein [Gemmataceae bacterium]
MNPFDQAARYAVKLLDAEGFCAGCCRKPSPPGVGTAGSIPNRFRIPASRSGAATPWPLSRVWPATRRRLRSCSNFSLDRLAPCWNAWRNTLCVFAVNPPLQREPRVPYTVVAVLLNLTGPAQAEVWTMTPPDFGDLGLQLRVRVRTLREEDALQLLTDIGQGRAARCLLPWLPLMRGGDQSTVIEEWKRLAGAEADVRKRGDYGGLARVLAELSGRDEIWTKGLEGWNVEVSQVVLEWQAQARAEGREEGRAEERAEMLKLLRERLLRLLQKKAQAELPADLVAVVQGQTDPTVLGNWLDCTIDASSVEELRSAFGLA